MRCGLLAHVSGCWVCCTTVLTHNELSFYLQRDRPWVVCQKQTVSAMWCSVVMCLPNKAGHYCMWLGVTWYPYMQGSHP
jgi:hypothetical protein